MQLQPIRPEQPANKNGIEPTFRHDINECLLEIVRANGEVKLAAERLGVTETELRTIIAVDPNAPALMAVHLKALLLLKTFQMLGRTNDVLLSKLSDLNAFEAARTHAALAKLFSDLAGTQGDLSPATLPEAVLKLLPPTVREAVLGLVGETGTTG